MNNPITKERFEDILFDTSRSITEKRSFKKSTVQGKKQGRVDLISNGKVVASHVVTPSSSEYYEVV